MLEGAPGLTWILGRAGRVLTENGAVRGLALEDGPELTCRSLVITTGTFLNGLIHIGPEQTPAGRAGEPPSRELSTSLKSEPPTKIIATPDRSLAATTATAPRAPTISRLRTSARWRLAGVAMSGKAITTTNCGRNNMTFAMISPAA